MIEYIVFFIFTSFFILLAYDDVKVRMDRLKIAEALLQSRIDNNILKDDILIKNSQEYTNFLTKSRDEAYTYIEQVHSAFHDFEQKVQPIVDHFDHVGIVASSSPLYDQMNTIHNAYKDLKRTFPSSTNND